MRTLLDCGNGNHDRTVTHQIPGFEVQERGSTNEPKVFIEEKLPSSKHHVVIRRRRDKALDLPDVAEFANPILSDPHAIIEFTRDGRVC